MDILKTFKNKSIFHKALSLLICAVMILSVFTVSIVARADSSDVWDGSVSTSLEGSGIARNGLSLFHNRLTVFINRSNSNSFNTVNTNNINNSVRKH